MSAETLLARALDRYVRRGGNRADGIERLADSLSLGNAGNIASALVYWGFATERGAEAIADAVADIGMGALYGNRVGEWRVSA